MLLPHSLQNLAMEHMRGLVCFVPTERSRRDRGDGGGGGGQEASGRPKQLQEALGSGSLRFIVELVWVGEWLGGWLKFVSVRRRFGLIVFYNG